MTSRLPREITITPFRAWLDDLQFEQTLREVILESGETGVIEAAAKETGLTQEWLQNMMIPRRMNTELDFEIVAKNCVGIPRLGVQFTILGAEDDALIGVACSEDETATGLWDRFQQHGMLEEEAIMSMAPESNYSNFAALKMMAGGDRTMELHVASGPEALFDDGFEEDIWERLTSFKKIA